MWAPKDTKLSPAVAALVNIYTQVGISNSDIKEFAQFITKDSQTQRPTITQVHRTRILIAVFVTYAFIAGFAFSSVLHAIFKF
jgi:hypothetical protein